ncbi:hypothetical protein AUJ46_00185 [Candidatus Peregrinibacteria bacterium CG1_02_54_53]|nr:MAG: hypothetical protein AUJ46_00185 [Candidatus Peregrinibacteria bacterium CG1_02_54_53]
MSALLEAGQVEVPDDSEESTTSFVPWRLTRARLSTHEEAQILLGVRHRVGDVVAHVRREWEGVVQGLWVEGDGTIWVFVSCIDQQPHRGMGSFSVREDLLDSSR